MVVSLFLGKRVISLVIKHMDQDGLTCDNDVSVKMRCFSFWRKNHASTVESYLVTLKERKQKGNIPARMKLVVFIISLNIKRSLTGLNVSCCAYTSLLKNTELLKLETLLPLSYSVDTT